MADLILRLRVDPATGKRELVIDYTSDADALPIEHEDAHRQLANRIVEGGLASARLAVTREAEVATGVQTDAAPDAEPAPAAQPIAAPR
ncbi:MAG TPA: hypothetical protein VH165_19900 [Kofleriaceae bacterium]|jgi:hypothetical protein|nr:hypothetical protein [Kofleriaceae bacterium]